MLMNPINGIWITPLSNQTKCLDRADIIFFDKRTFVIQLLNNPDSSGSHIQAGNPMLLAQSPYNPRIRDDRLPFKEDCPATPKQGSIYNETMAYDPADIAGSEMNAIRPNIKHMLHAVVDAHRSASLVPDNSFGFSSSP